MAGLEEAHHVETIRRTPTRSPYDTGWRGLALAVLAPMPFYPVAIYGAYLYVGPNGSPRDLTYWEQFTMHMLAHGGGEILKRFIRRKVRDAAALHSLIG